VNVRNMLSHAVDLDDGTILGPGEVSLEFPTSDRMKGMVDVGILAVVPAKTEAAPPVEPVPAAVTPSNAPPPAQAVVAPAPGTFVTPATEAPTTVVADTSTLKEPTA
jgi:hypothetical protein